MQILSSIGPLSIRCRSFLWLALIPVALAACLLSLPSNARAEREGALASGPAAGSINTPTPVPVLLQGHVLLLGRPAPPDPRWRVPVSGTLLLLGGGPSLVFTAITD